MRPVAARHRKGCDSWRACRAANVRLMSAAKPPRTSISVRCPARHQRGGERLGYLGLDRREPPGPPLDGDVVELDTAVGYCTGGGLRVCDTRQFADVTASGNMLTCQQIAGSTPPDEQL